MHKKGEQPQKKSQSSPEEDDPISDAIGVYGRWQLVLTFLLSLVNIPCTFHIFAPTFHARDRDVWCARPAKFHDVAPVLWKNCTGQTDTEFCTILDVLSDNRTQLGLCDNTENLSRIRCEAWEFLEGGETIISEFNLLCDRQSLINLSEMMFLAGVALGGLVCGIISDKCGRKKTLFASIFIQSTLGSIIALAPWFEMYVVLRCMLGFISVSVVFSGFILSIELVGGNWRTIAGISYLFPVSVGYCMIAGLGYLLTNWRQFQLAISLPGFLFLGLWWLIPESPRWLLALGKTKQVIQILETAAKYNKKILPVNLDKQLSPVGKENEVTEKAGVTDLWKTPSMRKKTLVNFLIWFSVYLDYYGLVLNLQNIGGNLYINSILAGLVEVPAIAISILILVKGGRRWPLALTMMVSGIFAALAIPVSWTNGGDLQWLTTSLMMASKFCISSSNAIMPVYTAELYPTTIRNIGVGAANVSAGIALMLVPYLWESQRLHAGVPLLTLAVFGLVGGASVLLLPETGCGKLVDTLKEEEHCQHARISDGTIESGENVKQVSNNNCCAQ